LFGDHRLVAMIEFVEGVFVELERVSAVSAFETVGGFRVGRISGSS
jgi:hypothetical protein